MSIMNKLRKKLISLLDSDEDPSNILLVENEIKKIVFGFESFKHDFNRWTYYQGCYYERSEDNITVTGNYFTNEKMFYKFIDEYYE